MAKDTEEYIRMRGTVMKMLPDSTFEVKLDNGFELLAIRENATRPRYSGASGRLGRCRGIYVRPDPGTHRLALSLNAPPSGLELNPFLRLYVSIVIP
jgi:hypothetical protein